MKRVVAGLLLGTLIVLFVSMNVSYADISKLITVEGKLRNSTTNEPLEGTYNLTFGIWDASSGGNQLFVEEHITDTDEFGIFQVILGSTTTLGLPFDAQYYLETEVNGTVLSPRHSLTSSPSSYRANISEDVQCTGCVGTTDIEDASVATADIANDAVTLEKFNCVNANHSSGITSDYVAVDISGICDDGDGCTIRYIGLPSTYVPPHPRDTAWGYYNQYFGGNQWRFTGWSNGTTTIFSTTGDNGDSNVDNIIVLENYCVLTDDGGNPCTAAGTDDFCLTGVGSTGTTCYIWICD